MRTKNEHAEAMWEGEVSIRTEAEGLHLTTVKLNAAYARLYPYSLLRQFSQEQTDSEQAWWDFRLLAVTLGAQNAHRIPQSPGAA